MSVKQQHVFYLHQANQLLQLLEMQQVLLAGCEEAYRQLSEDATPEARARLLRGTFSAADNVHSVACDYASAQINAAGFSRRFGGQQKAEQVHAKMLPALQATKVARERWEAAGNELGITLPTEIPGVEIAWLADAELRDLRRAKASGHYDEAKAAEVLNDICGNFNITPEELRAWELSQGPL